MTGPRSPLFASARHARRGRWRTVVRGGLVAAAAVAILLLALVLVLWRYADSQIGRQDIAALSEPPVGADDAGGADGLLNVLVIGLDSREGLTEADLDAMGTEDVGSRLTDTIMLVQVRPAPHRAAVLSFPRDLQVDPRGELGVMKINAVHGQGGAEALVHVIQDLTGVDLDHYVEVDLAGFVELTDAIGGVEICLDEPKVDRFAGVDLAAGCQVLDGIQAAGFVRSRQDADQFGGADDFGRIARQQYFVRRAMEEVVRVGTLVNPVRVKRLVDVVADNVRTDRDLGGRQMLQLARSLKDLGPDDLVTRTVPGYWSADTGYTHTYPERAEALFQALRQGEELPDVGQDDPRENELVPGDVDVVVLNGEGSEGLAARVADRLTEEGFVVVATDNADSFDIARTTVGYAPDHQPRGRMLAAALAPLLGEEPPLEELDAGPDRGHVVLTVGADWPSG